MVAIAPPAFVIDQTRTAPTLSLVGLNPAEASIDAPQQKIIQILKKHDIPYCDLTEPLRAGQKTQQMYFSADGHWTVAGHQVVADSILACLKTTTN